MKLTGIFYNDNDRFSSAWLNQLIAAQELPAGYVDDRGIADIDPSDIGAYQQCHFFAGIGGWPLALALAGWSEDAEVWTGSCPCQPFSTAGKHGGASDPRHLWPEFRRLIAECRPPTIFGEQVASKAGREWLAGVRADLEDLGYAVGAADLCAAGAGAPHIRQRLFWVADAQPQHDGSGASGPRWRAEPANSSATGGLGDAAFDRRRQKREIACGGDEGDRTQGSTERLGAGFWSSAEWLPCLDGKARRIESGSFPLAHGVPNRVGLLRGYGNAIFPKIAAEFISAFRGE